MARNGEEPVPDSPHRLAGALGHEAGVAPPSPMPVIEPDVTAEDDTSEHVLAQAT
jgi:hypothetical protein